ncbi:MAG: hypothetical protein K2X35_00980 [Bryobacteraceae bacterium]|nr:hypothetical protein [Bryobacteraceae bacterium]
MTVRLLVFFALFASCLCAQVSGNANLNGRYYFRYVSLTVTGATVTAARSAGGVITFNGAGGYTVQGQQMTGTAAPAALNVTGTYAVQPGGFLSASSFTGGGPLTGRLASGAVIAGTEAPGIQDLMIAIPAPGQAVNNAALQGNYSIATLEFPGGNLAQIRNTFFQAGANGAGNFGNALVEGQAANLGGRRLSQTVTGITYSVSADGSGTLTLPLSSGQTGDNQLASGAKTIYLSADGNWLLGGSFEPGLHGILIATKSLPGNGSNGVFTGLFFTGGLQFQGSGRSFVGSANATGAGGLTWHRRWKEDTSVFDFSLLTGYSVAGDGSGQVAGNKFALGAGGNGFLVTGVPDNGNSGAYVLQAGFRAPAQSGTGVFLNPQGIFNGASFAPAGAPVAPGMLVTMFGAGLASRTEVTQTLPFPTTLAGVSLTVNGTTAPVYAVSPTQVSALVPFSATGPSATFVLTNNGVRSNPVEVPLRASAPGIFTIPRNGLGEGAILDQGFQVISTNNRARRGSFVQIFLTGLGVTAPPVPDGAAAPSNPLSVTSRALTVLIGATPAPNILYKGLAPTLAGLYQINVQIPANSPTGLQALAILTDEGYTDLADIWIQ